MHKKCKVFIRSLITVGIFISSAVYLHAAAGPEAIELDSLVNIFEPVTFDHALHQDVTSCATCHHHTLNMPAEDENCLRCHQLSGLADEVMCSGCHPTHPGNAEKMKASLDENIYHIDITGLKRAYHLKCLGCHVEMGAASGCEDCHPKREEMNKSRANN